MRRPPDHPPKTARSSILSSAKPEGSTARQCSDLLKQHKPIRHAAVFGRLLGANVVRDGGVAFRKPAHGDRLEALRIRRF